MELILDYKQDSSKLSYEEFWAEKSGDFDKEDRTHVGFLIQRVSKALSLDDYAIKRLEVSINTELPFFAYKRMLAYKWLMENFLS